MKLALKILALAIVTGPAISYFQYSRPVHVAGGGQHYLVVDEAVWKHSGAGLDDLRLYEAQKEVPVAQEIERGSLETVQKDVRILAPGSIGGKTQFILDMEGQAEYDRIELKIAAQNFVVRAEVEGQDDLHGSKWVLLNKTVLYDLSEDRLGGNRTLRLPVTTYRYLRVTCDGQIKPLEITGASASVRREEKEIWRTVGGEPSRTQEGNDQIFTFTLPPNMPVERVEFAVDAAPANFLRTVDVQGNNDERLGSGEISRIHTVRHGQKIDVDDHRVSVSAAGASRIKVTVRNGDDQPLSIKDVRLLQYERRLYFNAAAGSQLDLYYGDEKLRAPVYDYSRLFQKETAASLAELGPEQKNPAYTGRPDERPWSEQHPVVLWIAIILAVLLLGGVAIRSMRTATQS
jgi:hypothetical protein